MVEQCPRERTCHTIYQYVKVNKKYMEDYDKDKESLFLKC